MTPPPPSPLPLTHFNVGQAGLIQERTLNNTLSLVRLPAAGSCDWRPCRSNVTNLTPPFWFALCTAVSMVRWSMVHDAV